MKKYMSYAWIYMFAVMFMTAFLTYPLFAKFMDYSNIENREKADFPILSSENYIEYHHAFEDWFNDILPYRDALIQSNREFVFYGFKESASEAVIVGKKGWLFYNETMPDYKKINLYTPEQLETIRMKLEANQKYFHKKGIDFIVFIAPNKASIYGESFLPDYIYREGGMSRTEQLVHYIRQNTDVPIVFPENELLEIAGSYPEYSLYFHLDTHWNYLGGYCGTKMLLKELDIELPEINEIVLEDVNSPLFVWNGYDLANMMGMTGKLTADVNYEIDYGSDRVVVWDGDTTTSIDDFNTFCQTTSDAEDKRKVMFIRDSFGSAMLPFMASEFSNIYSPHSATMLDSQTIDEVNPDIVIYEFVERGDIVVFE